MKLTLQTQQVQARSLSAVKKHSGKMHEEITNLSSSRLRLVEGKQENDTTSFCNNFWTLEYLFKSSAPKVAHIYNFMQYSLRWDIG